jgi:hypothetical protein
MTIDVREKGVWFLENQNWNYGDEVFKVSAPFSKKKKINK